MYRILPKSEWLIELCGRDHIAAGIYEHPIGYTWWKKVALTELPNDHISLDDLKRFGILRS